MTPRAHHADCSCQACLYWRAGLALPATQNCSNDCGPCGVYGCAHHEAGTLVRKVQDNPSYRAGISLALDEIAETVAVCAPDDWSGSREDARRLGVGNDAVGRCGHPVVENVDVCCRCGSIVEDD